MLILLLDKYVEVEWLGHMVGICIVEYPYNGIQRSNKKRNELIYTTTWIEGRQKKPTNYMILFI